MIELSRKQIQSVRSTLRQAVGRTSSRRTPFVTFQTTPDAFTIRAANENVAIECRVPGNYKPACFAIPIEAIAACEGRQYDIVRFEQTADLITLRWFDANIPQSAQFATSEPISMPELPATFAAIGRQFVYAMADACDTTESDSTRYALNCVRLRGSDGQIAATDGQQALIQSGFQFPWTDEVLVPASAVFGAKSIRESRDVTIGRSTNWMFVRAGEWTIALKIEKDRRFPAIDAQVPDIGAAATTMVLAEDDADFLVRAANRLPGSEDANAPVTLDLNGAVVVRAKSAEQQSPTDLVLRNSRRRGEELKVSSNRDFLKRAIRLGFREIYFRDVDAPAFCRTDRRAYVWALLGKDAVLKPDATAIRIESPTLGRTTRQARSQAFPPQTVPATSIPPTRNRISMTTSQFERTSSTPTESGRTDTKTLTALIEDGESLRVTLRDVLAKTNALVVGLKRQRQQSNLMRAALKSLRAVQAIES